MALYEWQNGQLGHACVHGGESAPVACWHSLVFRSSVSVSGTCDPPMTVGWISATLGLLHCSRAMHARPLACRAQG